MKKTHYINEHIFHPKTQNKRRHNMKQQKKKMVNLLSDFSTCITCLLALGLPVPDTGYGFWYDLYGYAAKNPESELRNIIAQTISPTIPTNGFEKLVGVMAMGPPRLDGPKA